MEIQGVYISGNLRNPFEAFIQDYNPDFVWETTYNYPKPDFLSSSRKRLVPQMLYKGGIFKLWNKKQCVALQKVFFETLPLLNQVPEEQAEIAWFLYDLEINEQQNFELVLVDVVYTDFSTSLERIIYPEPSEVVDFVKVLQDKLDVHLEDNSPDTPLLGDILNL